MADADPESKTEEPTGKRIEQARSQGDVPKTMDLPQWATLSAVSGVVLLMGGWLTRNLVASLEPFLAHPDAFVLQNNGAVEVARMAMMAALPIFAIITAAAGPWRWNAVNTRAVTISARSRGSASASATACSRSRSDFSKSSYERSPRRRNTSARSAPGGSCPRSGSRITRDRSASPLA